MTMDRNEYEKFARMQVGIIAEHSSQPYAKVAAGPKNKLGAHGYSPKEKDMQVIFIASGPYFKEDFLSHEVLFQNVDMNPLVANIMGIEPSKTDGELQHTQAIRKQ